VSLSRLSTCYLMVRPPVPSRFVTRVFWLLAHMALNSVTTCHRQVLTRGIVTHVHVALLSFATCRRLVCDTYRFRTCPCACCDTCRHRVWMRGVSVYFNVPLCYCVMCHLPVCQRVIFSFCHGHLSGSDAWRRRGKFLFGLVSP
jgi:hypothetical protein